MSDTLVLQVAAIAAMTTAFVASVRLLGRYLDLRVERRRLAADEAVGRREAAELRERLERIERAVETTAVEVERIAEANRYATKLLAERSPAAMPAPRPERVITPH